MAVSQQKGIKTIKYDIKKEDAIRKFTKNILTNKKVKYNLFYNIILVNNKKGQSLMEISDLDLKSE